MSAYLVNSDHIIQIVKWAKQPGRNINSYNILTKERLPETAEDMAKCLALANFLSVKARYGDKDYTEKDGINYLDLVIMGTLYKKADYKLTAADIYNMCCCLSYQSCEVDNWIETNAYWTIHNIQAVAAKEMASNAKQTWEYKAA